MDQRETINTVPSSPSLCIAAKFSCSALSCCCFSRRSCEVNAKGNNKRRRHRVSYGADFGYGVQATVETKMQHSHLLDFLVLSFLLSKRPSGGSVSGLPYQPLINSCSRPGIGRHSASPYVLKEESDRSTSTTGDMKATIKR